METFLDSSSRSLKAVLQQKFPHKSMEKLKAGIFDRPQIRELNKDPKFDEVLSATELSA